MINEEARNIIESELVKGEELLWADRPKYTFDHRYLFLFSLSFAALISLAYSQYGFTEPLRAFTTDLSPLILPIVLGIILLTAVRHWYLKTEVYAATEKHIIIHSQIPTKHTHLIAYTSLTNVKHSLIYGRDTLNLTLQGKDAENAKAVFSSVTLGFFTRVTVQLKQLTNSRIPLEIITQRMETLK